MDLQVEEVTDLQVKEVANSLIYKYLLTFNKDLALKFKKSNKCVKLPKNSPSINEIVTYYFDTQKQLMESLGLKPTETNLALEFFKNEASEQNPAVKTTSGKSRRKKFTIYDSGTDSEMNDEETADKLVIKPTTQKTPAKCTPAAKPSKKSSSSDIDFNRKTSKAEQEEANPAWKGCTMKHPKKKRNLECITKENKAKPSKIQKTKIVKVSGKEEEMYYNNPEAIILWMNHRQYEP